MLLNILSLLYAQKQNQSASLFRAAKPFYFSGLIAYSQRNDHFCGCKGTNNMWNTQHFLSAKSKDLSFFILWI